MDVDAPFDDLLRLVHRRVNEQNAEQEKQLHARLEAHAATYKQTVLDAVAQTHNDIESMREARKVAVAQKRQALQETIGSMQDLLQAFQHAHGEHIASIHRHVDAYAALVTTQCPSLMQRLADLEE